MGESNAVDYANFDQKDRFTLWEAAMAWCEVEEFFGEPDVERQFSFLKEAVEEGDLLCKRVYRPAVTLNTSLDSPVAWAESEVRKSDLRAFAERQGEKPPFLFPENRKHQQKSKEKRTPSQSKSRRDQQIDLILEEATTLGYDPMHIPYGGKRKIKEKCRQKHPRFFTETGFDHAWKGAKKRGIIEIENPDQYR